MTGPDAALTFADVATAAPGVAPSGPDAVDIDLAADTAGPDATKIGLEAAVACRISVVVPTYKRPECLDLCLAALLAQDLDPAAYEVIVVDDAACESTRRQVEPWSCRAAARGVALRYLPNEGARHGPAAARNAGWRAARGTIIAFTDDDCLPDPGWLSAGLAAFHDGVIERVGAGTGRVDGVMGRIMVPLPERPTDYELNAAGLANAEFVTANCFCRRAALQAIGGFDPRFTAAWREDSDLHFTLLERSARLVTAPEAVVVHPVRAARWGVSLSQQRKSMFNALLYKKHAALYRRRIQAAPPGRYYAIVTALGAALLALARGRYGGALLAGSVWLLLSGRFCLRRLRGTSHAPRHLAEMAATSVLIPPLAVYWRLRGALTFRVLFF